MTYYNRFSKDKNWAELAFLAGRRLQSAELNEIQSLSLYRDLRLGNVIFGSGKVIDGCQIHVSEDENIAKITAGSVYYEGMIFDIPADEVVITKTGLEVIGLKVIYSYITHLDDPTLKDPALGARNYGLPGADRKIATLTWVKDDPAAFPIFKIMEGEVMQTAVPPELEGLTPILARRTYDVSGDFLVSGMDGFVEPLDADNVLLVIEAGKAYVLGKEIDKLIPTKISVPKSTTTWTVVNETKTYQEGTDEYALNSKPVKQINTLTATVQITENITRGNIGGTADPLPHTPVVNVVSVVQGETTFQLTTDYLVAGNSIDWSPLGGIEPAGGSTYAVTYQYTKIMVKNVDYDLHENNVRFLAGDRPVTSSTFQITYDFYLARRDLFYLKDNGEFVIFQGQAAINPSTPIAPPLVLPLGSIYFPPNSDDVMVTNYEPKRLTQADLRAMLKRLERSEYNAAIADLDFKAQTSDPSIAKKGIMTDSFVNFEKADVTHELFDAMFDPDNHTLMLPINMEEHDLITDEAETTAVLKGRLYMLPYTEEVILEQGYGTKDMNINPYAVWGNVSLISLDPSQDMWIETVETFRTVWAWWRPQWEIDLQRDLNVGDAHHVETRILVGDLIPYIRQRTVTIKGENFLPYADNIMATFDGIAVALTPVTPTEAGVEPNTVKADGEGKFTATFEIPANVRCGTREVRAFNYVQDE